MKGILLLPGHHEALSDDIKNEIKLKFIDDLPMSSAFEQEFLRWKCLHKGSVVKMSLQEGAAVGNENYFPNI